MTTIKLKMALPVFEGMPFFLLKGYGLRFIRISDRRDVISVLL